MIKTQKQRSIEALKGWSEEAINLAELDTCGGEVNWKFALNELKGIVLEAKKNWVTIEEIEEYVWQYDREAVEFYKGV